MPIYVYKCIECGKEFEEYTVSFENGEHTSCKCGGTAHKIMSAPGGRWRYYDEIQRQWKKTT
jgi:putative FmdB family regulatory protein